MNTFKKITVMAMVMASPLLCSAQHFQRLYDVDTGRDWGWNIALKANGNYLITGMSYNAYIHHWSLFGVNIDTSDNSIISRHPVTSSDTSTSFYYGEQGEMEILPDGTGYVMPIFIQWPDARTGYVYSASGLERIDSSGNRIFIKTFTDTAVYLDFACGLSEVAGNKGYLITGSRQHTDLSDQYNFPAYLVKTDTLGDTLWTRTYQKFSDQYAVALNAIPLSDGRIVLYAYTAYPINTFSDFYYHFTPWFLLLDSSGHILKDTLYSHGYMTNGCLYADVNGGYVWAASYDSLYDMLDVSDPANFPEFIAHLDTNFRITWCSEFAPCAAGIHEESSVIRQMQDSGYLVVGQSQSNLYNGIYGFAAKVSHDGNIIWNNTYYSDSLETNYFRDGLELPDGNIVLTGQAKNDTLPSINQKYDLWLVGIDSNGCESPFCIPTSVPPSPAIPTTELLIYPNPTRGNITVASSSGGTLTLYSIYGQQVQQYVVTSGAGSFALPTGLAAGTYIGQFKPDDDSGLKEVSIVYDPQ